MIKANSHVNEQKATTRQPPTKLERLLNEENDFTAAKYFTIEWHRENKTKGKW